MFNAKLCHCFNIPQQRPSRSANHAQNPCRETWNAIPNKLFSFRSAYRRRKSLINSKPNVSRQNPATTSQRPHLSHFDLIHLSTITLSTTLSSRNRNILIASLSPRIFGKQNCAISLPSMSL